MIFADFELFYYNNLEIFHSFGFIFGPITMLPEFSPLRTIARSTLVVCEGIHVAATSGTTEPSVVED